jgi:hypothetical protein
MNTELTLLQHTGAGITVRQPLFSDRGLISLLYKSAENELIIKIQNIQPR